MKDYQIATIVAIRKHGGRIVEKTDDEIADLYREWSDITACAGWLGHSENGIKDFCMWATTAPCDRMANGEVQRPSAKLGEICQE